MYTEFDNPFAQRPEKGLQDKPFQLTCVKTVTYDLKPFGNFKFKTNESKLYNSRLNWIYFYDIELDHPTAMPLTPNQHKEWVKRMKQAGTEVFYRMGSGYFPEFYTITGSGITRMKHERVQRYWDDLQNGVEYET